MYQNSVLHVALAIMILLFVATMVAFSVRKTKIPYTVVLVLAGALVAFVAEYVPAISFLNEFRISPEAVFYIFLPTLIFESAFHMRFRHFAQNKVSIVTLSTLGLMLSAAIVAFLMNYFLHIPFIYCVLFGVLISATDPISVLSLFKRLGVSKRLSTIVEGESLFNDGTALVFFGLVLEFALRDNLVIDRMAIFNTFGSFSYIVLMGIFVGVLMGVVFSKLLDYVHNSKEIEISLTLIVAHFTFILAEYFLGASGILATVAAGIIMGNYGYYKISYEVREIMTQFWDYAAFVANSLLFLMVGSLIFSLKADIVSYLWPTLAVIGFVVLARMIMVYSLVPMVNIFSKEKIPLKWMHIINWSGLRGALVIALVLTLPEGFPYFREMLVFSVGVIFFTIVFYGLTIGPLLGWLGFRGLTARENFEHDENQLLISKKVDMKLKEMVKKGFISNSIYNVVGGEYRKIYEDSETHIHELLENSKKLDSKKIESVLHRHLLGIEKHVFAKLYYNREITQDLLNLLLNNLQQQRDDLNADVRIKIRLLLPLDPDGKIFCWLEKLGLGRFKKKMVNRELALRYEMYRARLIATNEVLHRLEEINKTNAFVDKKIVKKFEERYLLWRQKAEDKLQKLAKLHPKVCYRVECFLARQAAFHVEAKIIKDMKEVGMTSSKVYNELYTSLDKRRSCEKI